MSDSYDGNDSYDGGENDLGTEDTGDEVSAYSDSTETDAPEVENTGQKDDVPGDEESAFAATDTGKKSDAPPGAAEIKQGDETSAFASVEDKTAKTDAGAGKKDGDKQEVDYSRPTHWRAGMRDEVWENAKDEHGRVRDPVSGKYMSKDSPWDMGHKPGYEFHKHQESARQRGISREEFLEEYYNADHYRPELPSSNRSHKGESKTDDYFGD